MTSTPTNHLSDSASGRTLTAEQFQTLVSWVAGLLVLIVATGAAVRLTESGLGCEDWPNCQEGRLTPDLNIFSLIEFGNRVLSGFVGLGCFATVWGARRRSPQRPGLLFPSWCLVAGAVAQILLGAVIIRLELHPISVGGHFLLSMLMLGVVALLWVRAQPVTDESTPTNPMLGLSGSIATHAYVLCALAGLVVFCGVLVTGTGPNSGDARAERLPFEFDTIARVHGITVWVFVATLVGFLATNRSRSAIAALQQRPVGTVRSRQLTPWNIARWLLYVSIAQGAVGYLQYFTGVPPLLVELHILGSMATWILAVLLCLGVRPNLRANDLGNVPIGVVETVEPV